MLWQGEGIPSLLVPMFLPYDYSFRPDHVSEEQAVAWAAETDVVCTDEFLLHPDPYPSRSAWSAAPCKAIEQRLQGISLAIPLILLNHFPLRQSLVK
jgi:hypothetical protein